MSQEVDEEGPTDTFPADGERETQGGRRTGSPKTSEVSLRPFSGFVGLFRAPVDGYGFAVLRSLSVDRGWETVGTRCDVRGSRSLLDGLTKGRYERRRRQRLRPVPTYRYGS